MIFRAKRRIDVDRMVAGGNTRGDGCTVFGAWEGMAYSVGSV